MLHLASPRARSRIAVSFTALLIAGGVFSLFRLLFLYDKWSEFEGLSASQLGFALLHGMRFDFAILALLMLLPLLLQNLPFAVFERPGWVRFCHWLSYPVVLLLALLLAADIIYYDYVSRHIGHELLTAAGEWNMFASMSLSHWPAVLSFVAFAWVLGWLWHRSAPKAIQPRRWPIRWGGFVLVLLGLLLVGRGGVQGKPLQVIDAFDSGDIRVANLSLNGAFSGIHTSRRLRKSKSIGFRHYDDEALKQVRATLPEFSGQHPFLRPAGGAEANGKNLIFVLLESWSYKYIDALAGNGYGVTPNFDQLLNEGLRFERFYAAGQRSINGIQATLTGIPTLDGQPHLGYGLSSSDFSRLGALAVDNGYRTLFVQSSTRDSFRMSSIAAATGFQEYYGMEDMPLRLDYPEGASPDFGWDYETWMTLLDWTGQPDERPFLAYLFTGTTHVPYTRVPAEHELFAPSDTDESGFLNTLRYADWALGEFMAEARQQPWFDDTIFIFTADHTLNYFRSGEFDDTYHIPLLLYAPGEIEPGIDRRPASQLDLLPTITDLLDFPQPVYAYGQSLLGDRAGVAVVNEGPLSGAIGDQGYVRCSLKDCLEQKGLDDQTPAANYFDGLKTRLRASLQLTREYVSDNRWGRPAEALQLSEK